MFELQSPHSVLKFQFTFDTMSTSHTLIKTRARLLYIHIQSLYVYIICCGGYEVLFPPIQTKTKKIEIENSDETEE